MNTIRNLFAACVILFMAGTVLFFNRSGSISEKENRTLAKHPLLITEGTVNRHLFMDYDEYFSDRFGFRQPLILLNTYIQQHIFKEQEDSSRAIVGKNGWYFFTDQNGSDNLSDFYKSNLLSAEACSALSDRIKRTTEWCAQRDIKVLFMICPNKHSIYTEYYPFSPRPEGMTRADQICGILDALHVPYSFSRDFLLRQKAEYDIPLYWETDSHWNPLGAYLACGQLFEQIQAEFPNTTFPDITYEITVSYSMTEGDLLPLLRISRAKSTRPSLRPQNHEDLYTHLQKEAGLTDYVHTKSPDATLPRALVFRDSFCNNMIQFLSPLFSEAEYMRKRFEESDKKHIEQYKPDIIIFEAVERNAPSLP